MALRRQLLLVALLTLALPWAGCEYIREMEAALREGQQAALAATAQAVEARLRTDKTVVTQLELSVAGLEHFGAEPIFYAHPLPAPVVVDGYGDDWRGFAIPQERLPGVVPPTQFVLGDYSGILYAHIEVADANRQFFDPSKPLSDADHLLVQFGESRLFRLFSAAPGALTVERHLGRGVWQRQHQLSGYWNELEQAYALELRMPLSWGTEGLAILPWDGETQGEAPITLRPQAVLREESSYSDALAIFARPGVRLSLTTTGGWIIGAAGGLDVSTQSLQPGEGLARQWVRRVLGQPDYPYMPADEAGRLTETQIAAGRRWYRWVDSLVGRVTVPLALPSADGKLRPELMLVAEQSMDSLQALTTGAMGRLLWYTTLATLAAGIALLAYASVLSWRIRRLSRAAQEVVDSNGRILAALPGSRSRDEIGDLARSYAALLQRLGHYNQYLETLGGKLSHELRTPLAIVRSSLDNLSDLQPSAQQQIYLGRASDGAARLSRLLNAMGAASRLEQSLQHSERETLDLAELLGHLLESYRSIYAPRELRWICDEDGPCTVDAAPELLAQMCDKLLENAADFTGDHGLIEVRLTRHRQHIQLHVINTGPPIPDHLQGRLFDSLTSGRSGEGHHLGLGLYVVRLIVEYHAGQVRAFNHPEGGKVVFEILFPAAI